MSDKRGEHLERPARLRVMIADDVMETRRSTRLLLSLIPEVKLVAIAHDGRQAVEMAREHKPDIALMDISMPELDGVSAIEQMLKHQPEMGCIVISAERHNESLRRAMASGAKGYLVKPITAEELAESIRRVARLIQEDHSPEKEKSLKKYERRIFLQQMAMQFVKARRTDNKALAIFEELAADPDCDVPWLQSLAVIYVFRQEWGKLQGLAKRMAQVS